MSYEAMLLSARIAGFGANLFAARQQKRMTEAGIGIERGEIGLRMQQEQLRQLRPILHLLSNYRKCWQPRGPFMGLGGRMLGLEVRWLYRINLLKRKGLMSGLGSYRKSSDKISIVVLIGF